MAEQRKKAEGEYLMYQGKPLVRENNQIIYGDLNHDPYVLVMEILKYKGEGDNKVPDDIMIEILDAKDPNKCIKQGSKKGFEAAFTLGLTWLDMELKKSQN